MSYFIALLYFTVGLLSLGAESSTAFLWFCGAAIWFFVALVTEDF